MIDPKAIGAELAAAVKTQIDAMTKRIAELEQRLVESEARPAPVSVSNAFIDRAGNLVLTMSNGSVKDMGQVVGKDGDPGVDGFGFDDFNATYDGEKTVTLKFARGDVVKEFPFVMPVVIDRGVFKEGKAYDAGDAVSHGGSIWIAQKSTTDKPEGSDDWRLSVKRGRDGKSAFVDDDKPRAPIRVPAKGV